MREDLAYRGEHSQGAEGSLWQPDGAAPIADYDLTETDGGAGELSASFNDSITTCDSQFKGMPFFFRVGDRTFNKDFQVNRFNKLPTEERLLIAVGQSQAPAYSCLETEEQKTDYVIAIVNKEQKDDQVMTPDELEQLIVNMQEAGFIHVNGRGPELTEQGMDCLLPQKAEPKKKSLKQPTQTAAACDRHSGEEEANRNPSTKLGQTSLSILEWVALEGVFRMASDSEGWVAPKGSSGAVLHRLSTDVRRSYDSTARRVLDLRQKGILESFSQLGSEGREVTVNLRLSELGAEILDQYYQRLEKPSKNTATSPPKHQRRSKAKPKPILLNRVAKISSEM